MFTPRQAWLAAINQIDQIRGAPVLDITPSAVTVVTRTWPEGQRGVGNFTETLLPLPAWIPVRHITQREVAGSGGLYELGDVMVGPIRPSFVHPQTGQAGGFTEAQVNPQIDQEGIDVLYRFAPTDPTGTGIVGEYVLVDFRRARPFRFELVVRRSATTP